MLPLIRLILTLFFFGISLLTFFPAPTIFLWRLAIIATEFGHWLLLGPILLLVWECSDPAPHPPETPIVFDGTKEVSSTPKKLCLIGLKLPIKSYTIALAILGACLFFIPAYQARILSQNLAFQLGEAYGPCTLTRPPFSLARLWFRPRRPLIRPELFQYPTQDGSNLDLAFYPSARTGLRPCIVVVHGGGWNSGDYRQLPALNQIFAQEGYHVASISYRLAPTNIWPAQKEDLLAALAYLRQKSARLQIDDTRFVFLGRSAGGQLALATCYGAHDPSIRGCISLYAPTDMTFAYRYGSDDDILQSRGLLRQFMGGTPDDHPQSYQDASPRALVDNQSPPTLLLHGIRDELVWYLHSHRLQRAVLEAHRPFFLLEMPWATHAFDLNADGPAGQLSVYSILWFLEVVTKLTSSR